MSSNTPQFRCSCCDFRTTKADMESRHGEFNDFVRAIWNAVHRLMITPDEARAGIQNYKALLANAPTEKADPR